MVNLRRREFISLLGGAAAGEAIVGRPVNPSALALRSAKRSTKPATSRARTGHVPLGRSPASPARVQYLRCGCRAASTNNVMTVPFRRLLTVLSTLSPTR
jgi:hypothetical protein